jgi:hypothetical protein
MSEEERYELQKRVELTGRQLQDYLIKSTLHQKIIVIGNKVQFERLKANLDEIAIEFCRIGDAAGVNEELLVPIRTALEIINDFEKDSDTDEDANNGIAEG